MGEHEVGERVEEGKKRDEWRHIDSTNKRHHMPYIEDLGFRVSCLPKP